MIVRAAVECVWYIAIGANLTVRQALDRGDLERAMTARYVVTNALCTLHALEFAGTRTGSLRGDVLRLVEEVRP